MDLSKVQPGQTIASSLEPIGHQSSMAGYSVPLVILSDRIQSGSLRSELAELAGAIIQDPLRQRQLCDRVYQLMQEDLYRQRDRSRNY